MKGAAMLPVIGLLGAACAALGGYVLLWYHDLSKDEREEADRLACQYAMQLYNRKLDQLSLPEKALVTEMVQRHF
jgi:hypothetical protein